MFIFKKRGSPSMRGFPALRAREVSIAVVLILLAMSLATSPIAIAEEYKKHSDYTSVSPDEPLVVRVFIMKEDRVHYKWDAGAPLEFKVVRQDGYLQEHTESKQEGEGEFIAWLSGSYNFTWTNNNSAHHVRVDYSYSLRNDQVFSTDETEFDIWYAFPFIIVTIVGVFLGIIFMIAIVRQRQQKLSAKDLLKQTETYFKAFSPTPPPKVNVGGEAVEAGGPPDSPEPEATAPEGEQEDEEQEAGLLGAEKGLDDADRVED
jgi:hypothetical protein